MDFDNRFTLSQINTPPHRKLLRLACLCENTCETDQRLCFRYAVQYIYFLNPKFQACRCTTRSVSGPGRKSQRWSWILSKRLIIYAKRSQTIERAKVCRGNERVFDQSFATTVRGHYHIGKEGSENSGRN